jgi:DNA repair exonuclease SbcCD ATPase subunit
MHEELEDLKEQKTSEVEDLKKTIKDRESECSADRNRYEKEVAIYKQKIEFTSVQLTEIRTQLDESKRSQEQLTDLMEEKNDGVIILEQHESIINQIKEAH